jgi:hypothetical protein
MTQLIEIVRQWIGLTIYGTKRLKYRQLAEQADDPVIKTELLELASVCDEVANNIEDHLTGR